MSEEGRFLFAEPQCERLLALRAVLEEEESEEGLEHLRQQEQDAEIAQSLQRLLREAGFAQGKDLNYGEASRLLTLARAVCPNPNLDMRILRQVDGLARFNEDLRFLLYGESALPLRLRLFLHRHRAGAQTAFQLLCLAFPKEFPLFTRALWESLALSPVQEQEARTLARRRYELPDEREGEKGFPESDPVLRGLAQCLVLESALQLTEARDYLHLYRLLSPITRRGRRTLHFQYLPPPALLTSAPRVQEARDVAYRTARQEPPPPQPETDLTHTEVLREIEGFARGQGYHFAPYALRNYYISLQSKPFCLLAGVSGSGKTLLTHLFAEALTANITDQYLLFPVRPDWADSSPLLGYVNLLAGGRSGQGQFVSTPFLEFVLQAGLPQNRYRAYFLCLDEVNLARIEHYGAELLSAMEMPHLGLLLPDGSRVPLPPNLFLSGTLNLDEATHTLSRKVLDRANTLLFEDFPLALEAITSHNSTLDLVQAQVTFLFHRVKTVSEAQKRLQSLSTPHIDLVRHILERLEEANALLRPHGFPFAYRVRDEILCYCANSFDRDGQGLFTSETLGNLNIALDLQLLQKVLPRLTGTRAQLETLLQECEAWLKRRHFPQTLRRVERLRERLSREGYLHFDVL